MSAILSACRLVSSGTSGTFLINKKLSRMSRNIAEQDSQDTDFEELKSSNFDGGFSRQDAEARDRDKFPEMPEFLKPRA
jgi:hypothetical protein